MFFMWKYFVEERQRKLKALLNRWPYKTSSMSKFAVLFDLKILLNYLKRLMYQILFILCIICHFNWLVVMVVIVMLICLYLFLKITFFFVLLKCIFLSVGNHDFKKCNGMFRIAIFHKNIRLKKKFLMNNVSSSR